MPPKPAEPDMTTYSGRLAARLRELRKQSGLTVDEVVLRMAANGFVVATATYYQWETGRVKPNLDAIPAIVEALSLQDAHALLPSR